MHVWGTAQISEVLRQTEIILETSIAEVHVAPRDFYEDRGHPDIHPIVGVYPLHARAAAAGEGNLLLLSQTPFTLREQHTLVTLVSSPDVLARLRKIASPPVPESDPKSLLSFLFHPRLQLSFSTRMVNPHDCMRWGLAMYNEWLVGHGEPDTTPETWRLPKGVIGFAKEDAALPEVVFTCFFDPSQHDTAETYLATMAAAAGALQALGISGESVTNYSDGQGQHRTVRLNELSVLTQRAS